MENIVTEQDPQYDDDVTAFRQPMVTSIGIMLGFILAFLANWAVADETQAALQTSADWLVAGTLLVSVALMVLVLSRLLNNRVQKTSAGQRYQLTFRLYIVAIILSLSGLTVALIL
jgi:nitrate reductase gamma subunit